MSSDNTPYRALGERLKFLREQWRQSVKEVSTSLEIDEKTLVSIEEGKLLPEQELLDLLISHFLLTEDQADDLRDLAEIPSEKVQDTNFLTNFEDQLTKQLVMFMPIDNRIIYVDGMQANVNDHGVIIQFLQHVPGTTQPTAVSRVGMSRAHAEKMIEVLQQTLNHYDANKKPKQLPTQNDDKLKDQN